MGWRNFFSSCAVVSVFGSGGKLVLVLHTYVRYLTNFFGANIFLIVVEVLRYFVHQFSYFRTNFLVESEFSFPT